MCTKDRFCSRLGVDEKQLLLFELNGATEEVLITPENEALQVIYRNLIVGNLLELQKMGTRQEINLWPLGRYVIPAVGKTHASLTEEGGKRLRVFSFKGFEVEEGLDNDE